MTEKKRRKFAHQILGLIAISALVALAIFLVLTYIASVAVEEYCFQNDVVMTEFDWIAVDRWIFGGGGLISMVCFSALFLALLAERLAYIRKLTQGIDALRQGQSDAPVPLEGNNELTELADAINQMSQARQQIREKERILAGEKDQLIRTLSHDIRTPLTSILAYSEYLAEEDELPAETRKAHLHMIRRKAEQIRDLTDILLDGSKRKPEYFENARLLMEQLAQEFEADLEETFPVSLDFDHCPAFAGNFDLQELRRIFDNLSSNVRKYADPAQPVRLAVCLKDGVLTIRQSNSIRPAPDGQDSYQLGIRSIRRIVQHYDGRVETAQDGENFVITMEFAAF